MIILNIQRMSTEDGPGLRTTLFVKGCPLSCKWCHNPESISYKIQNEWIKVRCMKCLSCVKVCPTEALTATDQGIIIDRDKCLVCNQCVETCPTGALEPKGENKTVDEVYAELIKDKAYWGKEGGITVSGGEALSQSKEVSLLLKKLKKEGVHTAVDTSGFCSKNDMDSVLPYTDLFLYDLKVFDGKKHKELTGQDNKIIIDNFRYLVEKIKGTDKKIWIRTPIIPSATDDEENIAGIASLIKNKAEKWEMCAFNNLCLDKYERLYLSWEYKNSTLMSREKMDKLLDAAKAQGINNVCWTGAVK